MNSFDKPQLWTITDAHDGQRIDNFLFSQLKGVPKTRIYRILRKGEVRVNKGRIKAVYRLKTGDIIRIPPIRVAERENTQEIANFDQVKNLEKSILFENNQYMVVNKPSGIAVHGGSGLSFGVIEGFRALRPKEKFLELVHRIDKDTSGCLLIAKRRSYLVHFQNQLRHRKMNKEYLAVVNGQWPKKKQWVDVPLLKTERKSGERIVLVDANGKPSQTRFFLEQTLKEHSLVRAKPITGRTHQIRVHAAHCGCPLLGDEKYSNRDAELSLLKSLSLNTFLLHAQKLSFTLPDDEKLVEIEAPVPDLMQSVISALAS